MEAATTLAKLTGGISVTPDQSRLNPAKEKVMQFGQGEVMPSIATPRSSGDKEIFPERLMAILNDKSIEDTITWLPHGRSFVIIRPDVFMEKVLPKYLPPMDARASTKYPSFTRKLNRW
jgi:hypothetical protein